MVKRKRHIWFFISGIGTANLIMGLAIYYGIAAWVSKILMEMVHVLIYNFMYVFPLILLYYWI